MMDLDLKARWLEALRSGRYPKGKAFLNADGEFCALGVFADVVDHKCWKPICEGATHIFRWQRAQDENEPWHHMDLPQDVLSVDIQKAVVDLSDENDTFGPVIEYIENSL